MQIIRQAALQTIILLSVMALIWLFLFASTARADAKKTWKLFTIAKNGKEVIIAQNISEQFCHTETLRLQLLYGPDFPAYCVNTKPANYSIIPTVAKK